MFIFQEMTNDELLPIIIVGARRPRKRIAKKVVVRLSTTSPEVITDLRKKRARIECEESSITVPSQPPKKRGRPNNRKNFYEDNSIVLTPPPPSTPPPKKRGRPRKNF